MAFFSKNIKFLINRRGFTLIELLVVMAIIGILAALLISMLNPLAQFRKSRDSRRKSDMREMKTSLMLYRNTCDTYPTNNASNQILGCGTCASPSPTACNWGSPWSVNSNSIMKILPKDPSSPSQEYQYTGSNAQFKIATCLENQFDPSGKDSRDRCGATGLSCSSNNEYVVCED